MKLCPVCHHKLYGEQGKVRVCKFCGYSHDPNYLRRKNVELRKKKKTNAK